MGVVYKAEEAKLERNIALKFLPPELTEDSEARERFVREAKAAAALSHNHTCTVFEIGEEENQLFIAMECIDGESLEAGEALARGFKEDGYRGALQSVAEMLAARSKTTYVSSWQIGTLYTRAGKNDEALDWLEKAYQAHDQNMPYLGVDPIFDILRDDPRYQDLLRRMKLPPVFPR